MFICAVYKSSVYTGVHVIFHYYTCGCCPPPVVNTTSVVDPVSVEGNISVNIVQCDIIVSCIGSPQETVTIDGSSTGTV